MSYASEIEALGTPEGWQAAYKTLDAAGTAALPEILSGIRNRDWRIRRWCVALLDHHGDQRCVYGLVEALKDPSPVVRRHAVHSLGCQRCKNLALDVDIVSLLIDKMMNDESLRVRQVAAHMLGNQGPDPRALAALHFVLTASNGKLKSNAHWAADQHDPANPTVRTCRI
jgi:HEAT repeat protein